MPSRLAGFGIFNYPMEILNPAQRDQGDNFRVGKHTRIDCVKTVKNTKKVCHYPPEADQPLVDEGVLLVPLGGTRLGRPS